MNLDNDTVGSVIDSDSHSTAMAGKSNILTLNDFKTQVEQFLAYEKTTHRMLRRLGVHDERTIFTIFFGLWDILEYSTLEIEPAMRAVDYSVAQLFLQLDLLAAQSLTPMRVVIPQMIDTTFLPRFKPTKDGEIEKFARVQHQRLFLLSYWNTVLLQVAMRWQIGEIFMPATNAVVMEHVRMKQLQSEGISDASGAGKYIPLFEVVDQPCVTTLSDSNTTNLQAAAVEKCTDPTAHLFWSVNHRQKHCLTLTREQGRPASWT
jgi:hypothetical protein